VNTLRIIIGVCWLTLANIALAGPPFVTDDPESPPPGMWEINIPFVLERTPGRTEMNSPLFDLNYGLPNAQLKLEIPVEIVRDDRHGTSAGPGDLLLGVKCRFFADEKSEIKMGIYPQVRLPAGDHAHGLGDGRPAYVLPLLVQKSWDKWTLYGNVGYWWQTAPDKRDYWYSGAVLERELSQELTIGAELFGNTATDRGGRADFGFNIGGTCRLSEHLNLLFAAGRDFSGDTRALIYIGLQVLTK
jgi:hypothetical protein